MWLSSVCLFQNTFQVGVNDERNALLLAVILEAQPLVILTRQPDGTVVHLPAIQCVSLQFFVGAEIV